MKLTFASVFVLLTISQATCPAQEDFVKTTAVYKQVGELKIRADVYRPETTDVLPVVVWIHGGALINGHREGVSGRVRQWASDNGCAMVSIDYRLAPETQLPGIIEDLEDSFQWIRGAGAKQFHLDPNRIAVTGGSAGGCLTLTAGYRVKPRPQVLLAFWGYGDLIGDWYSKPSPHPRHHISNLSEPEAWKQVSGLPIADSRDRKGDGGAFYQFTRQKGVWPKAVTGWDPVVDAKKFHPFMAVKNVSTDYPPTAMIHGTADTDVPYEQSTMMAEQFEKHSVEHLMLTVPNGEHGLAGGDPRIIEDVNRRGFEFLGKHLPGK
ncbi:MAG: alpha/beta hydrolase [Planctomycetota bacterium]|nr:alpha/beta hydrolase [Planctomycetota bacterium]MDA1250762.1 alpha/beta hydrolase [Planctomycetota bacterium]